MAKGYRPVDRDQAFLLPPDMREWLPGDHPVHLVIAVIGDHLDTSVFHAGRKTGGAGAAGYDPDMLLMVLVWAYAHKESSSRRLEELCRTDVAFRVICAGNLPDHSTIARFRKDFGEAVPGFFAEVLVLCARLGMGRLGTVALDGTKIAAAASKAANRTEERVRGLAGQARRGRGAGADDSGRVREAAAKVERARQREAQRQAAAEQAAGPGPARNVTDPDSRLMPTRNGFIQGYNAQNVTSQDGLVIATELTDDTTDMAWYEPMT